MRKLLWMAFFGVWLASCQPSKKVEQEANKSTTLNTNAPPSWANEAIWYQIFVECFRNGNPNNDPTMFSLKDQFNDTPDNWEVTLWGSDWYKPDGYFSNLEKNNFGSYANTAGMGEI